MNCPHIPIIHYEEFSQRLFDRAGTTRLPIAGTIELTSRCNLRCTHCYINLPANDKEAQPRELTFEQWRRTIDEIVAEGCLWLLVTGGEPLLHPDFCEIYVYAKRQGLIISLFTNGTLITPKLADYLATWRPFQLELTMYGRTPQTYEAVTGRPGSFRHFQRGLRLLRERRIPFNLKTVVLTLNHHELEEMKKWAAEWGSDGFRLDLAIHPRIDGSREPVKVRLAPEEVVALDLADEARRHDWQKLWRSFSGPVSEPEYLYSCGAGLSQFHIDPYGKLSACILARHNSYSLPQGSFKQGWREFILRERSRLRQQSSPCSHCDIQILCDQCPGWGQMEHGNPEEMVEYLCQIAQIRARALGMAALGKIKETGS